MKIRKSQLRRIIKEEIQRLDEVPKWRRIDAARRGVSHPGSSPGPLPMDLLRRTGGYIPGPEKDPFTALRDGILDLGTDAENTFTMLVNDLSAGPEEVAENFPTLALILVKIDQQTMIDVADSL